MLIYIQTCLSLLKGNCPFRIAFFPLSLAGKGFVRYEGHCLPLLGTNTIYGGGRVLDATYGNLWIAR